MSARFRSKVDATRRRLKARRRYRPDAERLETIQLMSIFDDISNAFTTLGNDISSGVQQAVGTLENYGEQAIQGAEQAISTVSNFGKQLLSSVENEAQQIESTVSSGLSQAASAIVNIVPQVTGAFSSAVTQLSNFVGSEIPQITGEVTSDLQNFVTDAASNFQAAQADLTNAFNSAAPILKGTFTRFGNELATTFTSPAVETGLSYSLDGLLILGGVALTASSAFDGPAGALAGSTLIGAGIGGIDHNAQHANSDGTVSGSWSWASYGETLGIGAATGLVSGGAGVAGAAAGGGVLAGVVTGAAGGAASGALNQFLTNAANGQSLGDNVGFAAGLGGAGGALFGGLSSYVGGKLGANAASAGTDLVGGASAAGTDAAMAAGDSTAGELNQIVDELSGSAAGAAENIPVAIPLDDVPVAIPATPIPGEDLPTGIPLSDGEPQVAIPVPNEAPAPVTAASGGNTSYGVKFALKQLAKDTLKTFVAPQVTGAAQGALGSLGSNTSSPAASLQQIESDLTAFFTADQAPAPKGYVQSVTSVPLPFANGTALVGIGGDNAVYVNEQVPGSGSTGWVSLGGYVKSIAVTTQGSNGLPAIFGIGSDNAVYVNEQGSNGHWTGWVSLSDGGAVFKSITAGVAGGNTAEVFGIGFDNDVYTLGQNANGTWGGWSDLGGSVKQIAETSNPFRGTAEVFVLGSDNAIYANQCTNGVGWTGWNYISQGGAFKQIAAGQSYQGTPEVYGLGFDNAVYTEYQNGAGWTNLTDLGGYAQSISTSQGFIGQQVYAIDAFNNVTVDRYTFGGGDANRYAYWTGFQNLGGSFKEVTVSGPQVYGLGPDNHVYAVNPGFGKTDVGGYTPSMALGGNAVDVAIGSDHSVYVDEQKSDGTWTGAVALGGYVKSVAEVTTPNGAPVIFAIDPLGGVWADEQTPYGNWTGWNELPTTIQAVKVLGALAPNGEPEVVASDANGNVFVTSQNTDGSWNGWYTTGGVVKSFAVAQDPSGGAAIVAVGMDNAAWVDEQRADGTWSGFGSLGGSFKSVSAAQAPDGGLAIVGLNMDGTVSVDEQSFGVNETTYGSAAGWNGFVNLGGNATSVTAVNSGFGVLDVITQDSAGDELADVQMTGGQWSGFMTVATPPKKSS
jgi:hypothetical protein